jgi:hypothetical protein
MKISRNQLPYQPRAIRYAFYYTLVSKVYDYAQTTDLVAYIVLALFFALEVAITANENKETL